VLGERERGRGKGGKEKEGGQGVWKGGCHQGRRGDPVPFDPPYLPVLFSREEKEKGKRREGWWRRRRNRHRDKQGTVNPVEDVGDASHCVCGHTRTIELKQVAFLKLSLELNEAGHQRVRADIGTFVLEVERIRLWHDGVEVCRAWPASRGALTGLPGGAACCRGTSTSEGSASPCRCSAAHF